MKVRIFYENAGFKLRNWIKVRRLLNEVIEDSGRIPDDLNFILTDDESLRAINKQFLEHDYYTDVITFDYNENSFVRGEVYISVDTVKLNADNYSVSFNNELIRVMIHGTLHLCGYDDKTEDQRVVMRAMENKYLDKFREV